MTRNWSAQAIRNKQKESVGRLFDPSLERPASNYRRTILSAGFWDRLSQQKLLLHKEKERHDEILEIKKRFEIKNIDIPFERIHNALSPKIRTGYDPRIRLPRVGSTLIKGDDGKKKKRRRKRRKKKKKKLAKIR